jgi:hypothetical protein
MVAFAGQSQDYLALRAAQSAEFEPRAPFAMHLRIG